MTSHIKLRCRKGEKVTGPDFLEKISLWGKKTENAPKIGFFGVGEN